VTKNEGELVTDSIGKLSSRREYTGRVISLDVDTVRFPNGVTGELEMIRHPGASAVVPLLEVAGEPARILLIKQYRYAAGGFLYEVPAGRLDAGESPERCAHRELEEETGYTAGSMTPLTAIFTTPGFTDEFIHLFLAADLTPGATAREPDEVMEVEQVLMADALRMIETGEINDGKTITALLFAAQFRELE
jgi:ADP-ribose pyrophosphatase